MQTLQDQLNTGKKISKPSQDPVVAMKGMRYRTEVMETRQYLDRNLGQVYSWVENSDSSLDKVGQTMSRLRELTVQASNDTYEENQRRAISDEVSQLIDHIGTITNNKVNNQYIFNGSDTINAPYDPAGINIDPTTIPDDGENAFLFANDSKSYPWVPDDPTIPEVGAFTDGTDRFQLNGDKTRFINELTGETLPADEVVVMRKDALPSNNEAVDIEIMKGITLGVNVQPQDAFTPGFFGDLHTLLNKLKNGATGEELSPFLTKIDSHMDSFVAKRSDIGAKYNRVEMIEARLSEQEVTSLKVMSENEDVDAERVIINLLSEETLLRATLATSARIIQPSLMDFLR